jgi:hypothetical protein
VVVATSECGFFTLKKELGRTIMPHVFKIIRHLHLTKKAHLAGETVKIGFLILSKNIGIMNN